MISGKRLFGMAAAAARAFALTILVLEVFSRGAGLANWGTTEPHDQLGRWRVAGSRHIRFNEGFHVGRVNEHAYLGAAHPPARSGDALRIALVGDSFVESFQLFARDHFGRLLEAELARSGRPAEVLNFGMSGFDLEDMAILQAVVVDEFSPDYTLFFVRDSDFSLRDKKERPFFRVGAAGLALDTTFANGARHRWEKRPLVQTLTSSAVLALVRRGNAAFWSEIEGPRWRNAGRQTEAVKPEGRARPRWNVVSGILARLAADDRTNVLVTWQTLRPDVEGALETQDLPRWHIEGSLARLATNGVEPYRWHVTDRNGHWNGHAHRAIAVELAARLAQHASLER